MSTNYNVYVGATPSVQSLDPSSTLAQVRTTLTNAGLMTSTDAFLYENPITKLKTVFGPIADEKNVELSTVAFPAEAAAGNDYQLIQIISTSKTAPGLLGTTPPDGWFRPNGQMAVSVSLNEYDQSAITNNEGMFPPVLLENVQSANPDAPVTFTNCVIVQKGAIVGIDVSSWGAAGWGYVITAAESIGGANICPNPGCYIIYAGTKDDPYGRSTQTTLYRYVGDAQKNGDTIQIESNASLNIAQQYNVSYSTITVSAFSISQWVSTDGTTYSSDKTIPSGPGDLREIGISALESGGGWTPPPPGGGSDVPSHTTTSGSPTAGPPSKQTIGGFRSNIPAQLPATRSGGLTGSVEIYFLVFDSQADANTVIKVLNAGTMQV